MTDPLLSEVMPWPAPFAPRGWAFCQNQLLAISANNALFSLIGTLYGGDGRTTFALPDLRGRSAVGAGSGPGLLYYPLGGRAGVQFVTLTQLDMPIHSHGASFSASSPSGVAVGANSGGANQLSPDSNVLASAEFGDTRSPTQVRLYADASPNTSVGGLQSSAGGQVTLFNSGASESHENRMPFQVINFCISLYGLYPSRN